MNRCGWTWARKKKPGRAELVGPSHNGTKGDGGSPGETYGLVQENKKKDTIAAACSVVKGSRPTGTQLGTWPPGVPPLQKKTHPDCAPDCVNMVQECSGPLWLNVNVQPSRALWLSIL